MFVTYIVIFLLLILVGCSNSNSVIQPNMPSNPEDIVDIPADRVETPNFEDIPNFEDFEDFEDIPDLEDIPDIPGFNTDTSSNDEVQSITIVSPNIQLNKNSLFYVTTIITPINAGLKGYNFTWQTSDPSVAMVVGLGKDANITTLNKGTATITVTSNNGISATLIVTVVE
jgi:uncharacterized protein YjdB